MSRFFQAAFMSAILAIIATSGADATERNTGPYLSIGGGFYAPSYVEAEGTGLDRITQRAGPVVYGTVGYAFDNGLRVEIEGNSSRNGFERFCQHDTGRCGNVGGNIRVYRGLLNVAYDYAPADWTVHPYVEAGLGAQVADVYLGTPMNASAAERLGATEHGRGWTSVRPTWQVGTGFNLPLTDVFTATIGIRYVAGIGANKIGPGGDDAHSGGSSWELEGPEGRIGLRASF